MRKIGKVEKRYIILNKRTNEQTRVGVKFFSRCSGIYLKGIVTMKINETYDFIYESITRVR